MKTIQKKLAAMGLLALMIFTFCSVTAFAASGDEPAAPTAAVTAQAETETAPESAKDQEIEQMQKDLLPVDIQWQSHAASPICRFRR